LKVAENDLTLVQIQQRLLDERDLATTETSPRQFFKRQRANAARRGAGARAEEGQP
jgi:hypothetical protein